MSYYTKKGVVSLKSLRNNLILFLPSFLFAVYMLVLGTIILLILGKPLVDIVTTGIPEEEIIGQIKLFFSNYSNLIGAIISGVLFFLISFFVGASVKAIELGMFKDVIKTGKVSLKNIKKNAVKYYWQVIGVRIILFLIGTLSMVVLGLFSILIAFLIGKTLAILVYIFLLILLLFYLRLWFFFVYPIIVLDNKSVIKGIKYAHNYLRKHLSHTLFTWFTIFIVSVLFNIANGTINIVLNSGSRILINILTQPLGAIAAFTVIMSFVFLLRSLIGLIFSLWSNLFVFNCYKK